MKKGTAVRIRVLCVLVLLLGLNGIVIPPGPAGAEQQPKRPKIGLVLGGGGAKGAAHIGVLKVLEELTVPIDYIGGTSMGALVGSMYASGMSPEEIERVLTSVDWDDLFTDKPPRSEIDFWRKRDDFTILSGLEMGVKDGAVLLPRGFVAGQKVGLLLETLLMPVSNITDFDRLPTPYRAVATDLETGEAVVLKSGRLADAARASMSIPGVFPPIMVQGRLLADGFVVRNLPVDVVREMGADIIIAVDVGKGLPPKEKLTSMFAISSQMNDIMTKANVQIQIDSLGKQDIYINPDLGTIEAGDFKRGKEASERGMKAAREQEAGLRRLSVTDREYAPYLKKHQRVPPTSVRVGTVSIEGLSYVSLETVRSKLETLADDRIVTSAIERLSQAAPEFVRSKPETMPAQEISIGQLKRQIGYVYGMGDFELVKLEAVRRDDVYDLTVRGQENPWGPNYLRWGIGFSTASGGDSQYNILVDYTMRWVNRLGAEWKNAVEIGSNPLFLSQFYQPLESSRTFFVAPRIAWERMYTDYYRADEIIAEYRLQKGIAGVDLGIQPWTYGEARLGYEGGRVKQHLYKGAPDLPSPNFSLGALRGRAVMDQVDNVNFPHTGYLGLINYYDSMPGWGADDRYQKINVSFLKAFTYEKYTVLASAHYGSYINSAIPVYDEFTLGGFLHLSGYAQDQLRGQQFGLGSLVAYWKASQSLLGSFYLGGSLEAGNVWHIGQSAAFNDLLMGGSVFIGYDTVAGPLYLAVGTAEGGQTTVYFYLGKTFF